MPASFSDFLLHEQPLPRDISGACMLVRREAIEEVGLWDEGYFLHCEDLDWCMRFRQVGWDVLYVPDTKVIHQFGACSRKVKRIVALSSTSRYTKRESPDLAERALAGRLAASESLLEHWAGDHGSNGWCYVSTCMAWDGIKMFLK